MKKFLLVALFVGAALCEAQEKKETWWSASGASEISYPLSADNSTGQALFRPAKSHEPRPLLVALHSWSTNHTRPYPEWLAYCAKHDWTFIEPEFRGPNTRPEAMCSKWVVQDILDAVAYAKKHAKVDAKRIYLFGFSGGGMAALMMAGQHPNVWAGVSVWCPLTDARLWYEFRRALGGKDDRYANELAQVVGGDPLTNDKAAEECVKRSPVTYLHNAREVPISICVGIQDNIIPNSHSFRVFNILASAKDRFTEREIVAIRDMKEVPRDLLQSLKEPGYGTIYFRRESNNVRLTAVKGGHCFRPGSLAWLALRKRK